MYMIRVEFFRSHSDRGDARCTILCLKIFNERAECAPNKIASFSVCLPLIEDSGVFLRGSCGQRDEPRTDCGAICRYFAGKNQVGGGQSAYPSPYLVYWYIQCSDERG